MQGLLIIALAGCVAVASGLTFKVGGIEKELYGRRMTGKSHGYKGASSLLQQDQDGIDSRFNGPTPTGGSLQYVFNKDNFDMINPRNPNADWRWAMPVEVDATNGAFLRDAANTIDLVSIPLTSYTPIDNTRLPPLANQYEALVVSKQNISVMPGQVLSVNVKFACKTFNAEDVPLSSGASSVPSDDPSLVNCGFGILSYDESALGFSVLATSKGVWSLYERNRFELYAHPERDQKEFTIFQKLAERSSPYDVIDATIKLYRSEGKVEFIIDGEVKQTITDIGTIDSILNSEEGKDYKDVYTRTRGDLKKTEVQDVQVVFGIGNYPDATDPSNPSNPPLRGTRLTTDPTFYDPKAKFEDNEGKTVHWGEGASMTLVEAKIELEGTAGDSDSTTPQYPRVKNNSRVRS